ncbi:protein of unknown function [Anaerocolumna jejuensis DSM 15929]|uniref:DUF2935 domain-containing protein n=1 Tax=Anaerocolumna jejuensis DSM 15929 TaxID=1121322 RepID=A0A1M6PYM3_9FIRM|nr:DUF2935 domain-containing protein [Anaerocolumna jejuensis]SHK13085.1 protein of unknown function [Anaerocolumna jejuensis DSM 15929]
MLTQQQYVILSLELHMFFGRIMKEHSIFLEAGFTPANPDYSKAADQYKEQFEIVLLNAVNLGNGIITPTVASSGEIVTNYTLGSEQKTQNFTGIAINQNITKLEADLYGSPNPRITPELIQQVKQLNTLTIPLLDGLIDFKSNILNNVLSCYMFTVNYPLLIEHILREAKMYRSHLAALESGQNPDSSIKETELFWDQIMMEHALFIRGLLDPSENQLISTSNNFAQEYAALLQEAKSATDRTIEGITGATLQETLKYRDFKEAGTKGISECKIRSIILPLLGDHVLRESNHFIRLLKQFT